MKPILKAITENMYFWAAVGGLLAYGFVLLQKRSVEHIDPNQTQKFLSQTMAQSALRVVLSVGILFLAFKTGLRNGLACLIVYIIIRWIWMFAYLHKLKKEKEKE
jgi:membrane protein insertase Oxa1/YidC/SpoIIIJ